MGKVPLTRLICGFTTQYPCVCSALINLIGSDGCERESWETTERCVIFVTAKPRYEPHRQIDSHNWYSLMTHIAANNQIVTAIDQLGVHTHIINMLYGWMIIASKQVCGQIKLCAVSFNLLDEFLFITAC